MLLRKDETVDVECSFEQTMTAPVELGTVAGFIIYRVGGEEVRREKIVCKDYVKECDFLWGIRQLLARFLL